MKKIHLIFAAALTVLSYGSTFAQGNLVVTSGEKTFSQTETGSTTLFTYVGTAEEAAEFEERASTNDYIDLKMTKNSTGNYDCKLVIDHQNHAEYVVKMLITLGVEKVTVDGKEKPIMELSDDLKAMQKK